MARDRGKRRMESDCFTGYGLTFWSDKNVPELDTDGCCTTLWRYSRSLVVMLGYVYCATIFSNACDTQEGINSFFPVPPFQIKLNTLEMIQLTTIRRLWELERRQQTRYEPQDLKDDTEFSFYVPYIPDWAPEGPATQMQRKKSLFPLAEGLGKGRPDREGSPVGRPNPHSIYRAVASQFTCRRRVGRAMDLWALHAVAAPGLPVTTGDHQGKHLLVPAGGITSNEQEPQQCQKNRAYPCSENYC